MIDMQSQVATNPITAKVLLDLEQISKTRFRSNHNLDNLIGNVFGGQLLGQAVEAARRTVAEWPIHSCASYFLRKVAVNVPVDYDVECTNDGRRFATRRVVGSQAGKRVFDLLGSFHDPETSFAHQLGGIGDVAPPESLLSMREFVKNHANRLPGPLAELYCTPFPIELRPIDPENLFFGERHLAPRIVWFRVPSAEGIQDPRDHQSLLAFMSDYWLAGAAGAPHRSSTNTQSRFAVASQNHSMWFHNPVRTDQWLLYRTESPWAGEGRGLASGSIYGRDGTLVASAVQEVSMRFR
jgi:acyl-CoA thioesterase II